MPADWINEISSVSLFITSADKRKRQASHEKKKQQVNIIQLEKRNETRKTATFLSRSLPPRTNTILAFIGTVKDRAYGVSVSSLWPETPRLSLEYYSQYGKSLCVFFALFITCVSRAYQFHQRRSSPLPSIVGFLGSFANGDQLDCV